MANNHCDFDVSLLHNNMHIAIIINDLRDFLGLLCDTYHNGDVRTYSPPVFTHKPV